MTGVRKSTLPHWNRQYEVAKVRGQIPKVFCGADNQSSLYAVFNLRLMYRLIVIIICCAFIHSNVPGFYALSLVYLCFQFLGLPFEFLVYYGAKFRNRWFLGTWLVIGYLDFMGFVLLGIMSFFSTRSILFDISFFFRSISRINKGAKVTFCALWLNFQWWMYMVVWAAFIDIGRENEEGGEKQRLLLEEENPDDDNPEDNLDESLSESATSQRKKTAGTGYEYVIPASALSVKTVDMDKECGLSVKSVRLDDDGEELPVTPPPPYYSIPVSETPIPTGIPFIESESRGSSASTTAPPVSRLGTASGSEPGSRVGSAISDGSRGSSASTLSRFGSAKSDRSDLESRLGSAISRPASSVAGSPTPVFSSPVTPQPGSATGNLAFGQKVGSPTSLIQTGGSTFENLP